MKDLEEIIKTKKVITADIIKIYDELEAVNIDFMLGIWKGYEISTGHPMDGLLEPSGWFGKMFVNPENVHPLVMRGNDISLWALNPKLIPLTISFPKTKLLGFLVNLFRPFLQTKNSKARIRIMEHRGKTTATMIYDNKPIHDYFAKIDENTVLGFMDLKDVSKPFFWIMERDDAKLYEIKFKF